MPRQSSSLPDVVLLVVILFCILFIGIALVNTTAQQTIDNAEGERTQDAALLGDAGTWVVVGDTTGSNETVYDSRGYAVNLTGASDSYVETGSPVTLATDDTWTISVWSRVDTASASDTMTVLTVDGDLTLTYNGTASEWEAWYYDSGSMNSYNVSVAAPDQPGNFTNLMAVSNGSTLTLYRNNTANASVDVTTASVVDAPVNATNLDGRLEELRTFDDNLSDGARQSVVDAPLDPRTTNNRTARVMFDEPYRNGQYIFFTNARMDTFNATFSDGFAGSELQEGRFAITGADYEWNPDGPRIKPLSGGELDGAPVAYVDYDESTVGPGSLLSDFENAVVLAGLLPVLVIVGFIALKLQTAR